MRKLFFLILLLPAWAGAEDVDFGLTFPATYEDDAPLTLNQIQQTRVDCKNTAEEPTQPEYSYAFAMDGAHNSIVADLAPGVWRCVGRIRANNMMSRYSNELEIVVLPPEPSEGARPRPVTIVIQ